MESTKPYACTRPCVSEGRLNVVRRIAQAFRGPCSWPLNPESLAILFRLIFVSLPPLTLPSSVSPSDLGIHYPPILESTILPKEII